MDNEVKRFFDSIKFSSDLFNGVTVKKIIYNKSKLSYNVNLLCPNLIEKRETLQNDFKNKFNNVSKEMKNYYSGKYEEVDEVIDILNKNYKIEQIIDMDEK